MKPAYLLTKPDGSTVLLFSRDRAHGLAGHYGWTVRFLTALEARAHIRNALAIAKAA
jgi:hypothetical protein